jgi:hypothetical protein
MSSEKQIDANRINAQNSTGPNTPDGKAKTRLNAMRDGITGQVTTLSDEDRPIFEKLKAELIADLAPKTTMELKLASGIAWDTWRLDRLRAVEMNMYALGTQDAETTTDSDNPEIDAALSGALTFEKQSAKFALLSIYEKRLNSTIHKNLDKLRELQAERKANYNHDRDEEVTIARANDFNGLPYKAPAWPSRNGYVFSSGQILAAANRESVVDNAKTTVQPKSHHVQFAGACGEIDPHRPNSGLQMAAAA